MSPAPACDLEAIADLLVERGGAEDRAHGVRALESLAAYFGGDVGALVATVALLAEASTMERVDTVLWFVRLVDVEASVLGRRLLVDIGLRAAARLVADGDLDPPVRGRSAAPPRPPRDGGPERGH
jgi:hypothetical protein